MGLEGLPAAGPASGGGYDAAVGCGAAKDYGDCPRVGYG